MFCVRVVIVPKGHRFARRRAPMNDALERVGPATVAADVVRLGWGNVRERVSG
jgi:hypothetical protein